MVNNGLKSLSTKIKVSTFLFGKKDPQVIDLNHIADLVAVSLGHFPDKRPEDIASLFTTTKMLELNNFSINSFPEKNMEDI